jgi:hypothetical protein
MFKSAYNIVYFTSKSIIENKIVPLEHDFV